MDRGREIIVLETSREWVHVEANLTEERTVTGWVLDKGVVRGLHSERGQDFVWRSGRLRRPGQPKARTQWRRSGCHAPVLSVSPIIFPPRLWRPRPCIAPPISAGNWRKLDVSSRPSARERDAYLREGMEEKYMKEVIKKFPGTKWADLAAFHSDRQQVVRRLAGQSRSVR